jgi:hypothetical protein
MKKSLQISLSSIQTKRSIATKTTHSLLKLTIFHDIYDRVDVSESVKLKAFLIMLKDLALDYYYSNMSTDVSIIFDEVCFSMRNYFEDVEYRQSILFKWNKLILRSMMTSNENKSVEECLQLLIKQLRHLQHGLNSKLRSEKFIHNKLINACQNVFACQYACFKLSDLSGPCLAS